MRRLVLLASIVIAAATVLPGPAFATTWQTEGDLLNDCSWGTRSTFILDPGCTASGKGRRITRQVFLSEPYLSFYERHGFDRNFFTWAPGTTITDPYASNYRWTACGYPPDSYGYSYGLQTTEPDGRKLCKDDSIKMDLYAGIIRDEVLSGPLQGIKWLKAFVSNVCGNWAGPDNDTKKPSPVPRITGVKYEDLNGDGIRESGEPGLAGWTIELYYNGTHVATTTTGSGGSYVFPLNADTLPISAGTYKVVEVQKPGWVQSQAPGPVTAAYGIGQPTFGGRNFGNYRLGSISGRKFEDMNANGSGAGDPGLPNWTIDYSGPSSGSVVTGADGSYQLSGLKPGTYRVWEVQQPGWTRSLPGGSGVYTETVRSGAAITGVDFGNWRPATIEGRKFDDHGVDGSGTGDPGLKGWTIDYSGPSSGSTVTGADGSYQISGLKPGSYTVDEVEQPGWRQTAPPGGSATVPLVSGQVQTGVDFGNVCLGGVQIDVPEGLGITVGISEVSVPGILSNEPPLPTSPVPAPTTFASLLPGSYTVTILLPDGVFSTDPGLVALNGGFAIVKTVTVQECKTTVLGPPIVGSTPGKVTGGIRILVPGGYATAGFEFMQQHGSPRGTLEYNDHASGLRIHTSDINAIFVSGTDAWVFGHATIGGTGYEFRLHLVDAGEPGTSDRFELLVTNGYSAGAGETLDGGNVQIHTQPGQSSVPSQQPAAAGKEHGNQGKSANAPGHSPPPHSTGQPAHPSHQAATATA